MNRRIRDYGIIPGRMQTGPLNSITDVPGVKVGHFTVCNDRHHTGITVILPGEDIYFHPLAAACEVINGYGKSAGLIQMEELGQLETPIALTNTLNVGLVFDALVEYTDRICREHGIKLKSVNPVVGECNDGSLNPIRKRILGFEETMQAISSADVYPEEGCVGAGTGMICHGLKGGIGTSSRILSIGERIYTIGMLALCNHGVLEEFRIPGRLAGKDIQKRILQMDEEKERAFSEKYLPEDAGSCILVLATDLPLSHRQLKRVVKRAGAGLARLGSYWGHASGEIAMGFTTALSFSREEERSILPMSILREDLLNQAFAASCECAEECVLNALAAARPHRNCHALSEFEDLIISERKE